MGEKITPPTPLKRLTNIPTNQRIVDVYNRIKRGNLILQPEFQRLYSWDNKTAAELILSIIKNIDIKTIYAFQDNNTGKAEVIDGQQRLTSITRFMDGEFQLACNKYGIQSGWRWNDLPELLKNIIRNTDLRFITYDSSSLEGIMSKFQIFIDVNKGSKTINPQEIRNCMFNGIFNTFLTEMSNEPDFRIIFGDQHKRMKDIEFVLRYFAALEGYFVPSRIQKSLNRYMEFKIQQVQDLPIADSVKMMEELGNKFKHSLAASLTVFGQRAFRDDENKSRKGMLVPGLYLGFMRTFADYNIEDIEAKQELIRTSLIQLQKDKPEIFNSQTARNKRIYNYKLKEINKVIDACLSV